MWFSRRGRGSTRSKARRGTAHRLAPRKPYRAARLEPLENRLLLTHGPAILSDGSVEIRLDDTFDQFGFQPAIFQAYDATPENGFDDGLASFSVFDTGASVVTIGASDQLLFSLVSSGGVPIQTPPCTAIAEAVGGLSLVGHVSQRGTVLADGLHVSTLTFDKDGFPVFELGFHDPPMGEVADPLPGSDDFSGDNALSATNGAYNGFYLTFTAGGLRGEVREIVDYSGATRRFTFRAAFSGEPAGGDRFLLISDEAPFVSEAATSTVTDSTPVSGRFGGGTTLSDQDNFYEGFYVEFTSGALAGQVQRITDYTGATRTFHFARPFSAAPAGGDSFRVVQINTTAAAIAPDIQAFLGTYAGQSPDGCPDPASPTLPTLAGTPMLSPSPNHPNGLAVNIRPSGAFLDFSDFVGFEGLIIPVPDVQFQEPGLGIPDDPACLASEGDTFRSICTEPIRVPMEFLGAMVDQDGQLTEAYNPVSRGVTVRHRRPDTGELVELTNQVFLYDTGAQLSVISTAHALAFGLDLNSPEDTISVQTAGGVITDLPGYRIDSITVPLEEGKTLTFKNVWVFVVDAAAGLLDGILGMNLFNSAAAMLYDPWHAGGPVLELTYFTEHLFGLPFADVGEIEPNDVASDATPLRPGEFGVGELGGSDVVDYWASPGANEGDLIFVYVDTQNSTSSKDARLTVFDKNQAASPSVNNVLASDDDDGPGPSPVVAGVAVPPGMAGTVFYEVREAGGGSISQYEIYPAVVDPLDAADEAEAGRGANDTTQTATSITRAMMTGTLGTAPGSGDVDHYGFVVTEGSRIVVMVDNDPDKDGALTATRVSLLAPNGTEIFPPTAGDGDGNATAAGAVAPATSSGTYFVKVTEGASGTDNDYRFVVLVLDGGTGLLAANLVQRAETKKAQAEQTILAAKQEYERAIEACNTSPDPFCLVNATLQFLTVVSQASVDMLEAENVLTFAGTVSGNSLPAPVNVGMDLEVSIGASSISEKGGTTTATVRRPDTNGDLTVTLTSSDTSEATVVASVVIPNGQRTSPPFAITAVDDALLDGTQTVTITATAAGYQPGWGTLDVTDDEAMWRNPVDEYDVDNNGSVVPADVLFVINELNNRVYSDRRTGELLPRLDPAAPWFDVNGDGFATPADALLIINLLNKRANPEGEAGEPAARMARRKLHELFGRDVAFALAGTSFHKTRPRTDKARVDRDRLPAETLPRSNSDSLDEGQRRPATRDEVRRGSEKSMRERERGVAWKETAAWLGHVDLNNAVMEDLESALTEIAEDVSGVWRAWRIRTSRAQTASVAPKGITAVWRRE